VKLAAAGAGAASSIFKLDPEGLLNGLESLQKMGTEGVEAVKTGIEVVETLRVGAGGAIRASETKFDYMKKRSWYLALQGTALFIRQGRLSAFSLVVGQAPCRHNANFQWGICRQLGEIAVDPLWDTLVRQQAVDFLGELYRSNTYWEPHADVKQWILTILVHISELPEVSTKNLAFALLADLRKDGTVEFLGSYSLSRHLPLPITSPLLAQVQEIPKIEYDLHILRLLKIAEYKQAVYIAPMAKPSLQAPDDTLFPLMEKVKDFLAGDSQVMLILGDSGAGKSTFNRHLEHELWQDYIAGGRIPLFINLPSLERPEKDLVVEQLKSHNFLKDQIRELKLHRQLILICDGYDESQLTSNLHTTNLLNRSGQWNVKMIITCRTQYLGPDYRSRFAPKATDQYTRGINDLFQEAVIAPFSKEQIKDYVDRYVPLEPRMWVTEDYMNKLTTIPNLLDLVRNPFLLTLCLEALPNVVEGKSDLSRLRFTRVQLYDTFVQHWLEVNKRRLQDNKLDRDSQNAFEELLEDGFELNGIKFQQDLAASIFREQEGRPIVDYTQMRDGTSWKARFFGTADPHNSLLRGASLLSRVGTQHRFVHRSILEYFYSCIIYGPADRREEFSLHPRSNSSSIGDHPLSQRNLVVEPSIIQFLSERVEPCPGFKQQLLTFIEQSKTDSRAACAATNAITILVKAGVLFHNTDLRSIRVPGADLSGGQFDSAQLQEADLTGVNLTGSWIRQADFSKARMEEVTFGELPYLEERSNVTSVAYSVDGGSFAVGLYGGNINIYNTANWTRIRTLEGHSDRVSGIAYSPSGEQLLSGSWDHTVRLWNCKTGLTDIILKGHADWVRAVAYSPAGNQVASAGDDNTVRLWDPRRGAILFVLQGHTNLVNSIAYSPDGRSLVSGSRDGKLRIFDTHSGQMGLVLEKTALVRCVAYSPDGLRIIAGDDDGYLLLWESATGEPVKRLEGGSGSIDAVAFSPNGQWIASSGTNYTFTLWEAHSLIPVLVFIGHSSIITNVMFSPNSLQLASGSWDKTVRLWDVTTAGAGPNLASHQSDKVSSVAFSPDVTRVISGGISGTVRQYDGATGDSGPLHSYGYGVVVIVFSPDGRRIAAAGISEDIQTWNADTGIAEYVLQGHSDWVYALVYSPDSQWIASGSKDYTVRLWYACSGASGLVLSGHDGTVVTVAFSPCGLQLVSGSWDGTIRVWDVGTGESRVAVDTGSRIDRVTIRYSPIGMQIALQRVGSKHVELWHEESVEPLHSLQHDAEVGTISLSPCGHWIAIECDGSMWLWKLIVRDASQEWELALVMRDVLKYFDCIGWRPDALEFVTAGHAGSVHAWKLVETPESGWSVRLLWSSGRAPFTATDSNIVDVVGLSVMNQRLLEQRGAKGVALST
jgi:WD40 repeat protein